MKSQGPHQPNYQQLPGKTVAANSKNQETKNSGSLDSLHQLLIDGGGSRQAAQAR